MSISIASVSRPFSTICNEFVTLKVVVINIGDDSIVGTMEETDGNVHDLAQNLCETTHAASPIYSFVFRVCQPSFKNSALRGARTLCPVFAGKFEFSS